MRHAPSRRGSAGAGKFWMSLLPARWLRAPGRVSARLRARRATAVARWSGLRSADLHESARRPRRRNGPGVGVDGGWGRRDTDIFGFTVEEGVKAQLQFQFDPTGATGLTAVAIGPNNVPFFVHRQQALAAERGGGGGPGQVWWPPWRTWRRGRAGSQCSDGPADIAVDSGGTVLVAAAGQRFLLAVDDQGQVSQVLAGLITQRPANPRPRWPAWPWRATAGVFIADQVERPGAPGAKATSAR